MERYEYLKAVKDVIYLAYCGVNERLPNKARVDRMDITAVYEASKKHMLTAICAMSLEAAGVRDERFTQDKGKAIRKNVQLDIDREQILECFEKAGIWYMPLKGSILKDYYPRYGMRQMSDNDILFDGSRSEDVREIMESFGFTTKNFGQGNHDVYFKLPVSNFEMHTSLFSEAHRPEIYDYYKDIKSSLIKDPNKEFCYNFSREDFYIYLIAHEYKHYSSGGTGLRSILDTYVYLRRFGDMLDMEYIETECAKLGIKEFEKQGRDLAMDLFSASKLSDKDKEMLRFIVFSGTYGTTKNIVDKNLKKYENRKFVRLRYAIDRLTVPISSNNPRYAVTKEFYPWFYEKKYRLVLLFFYRLYRGMTENRKVAFGELKALMKRKG